MMKGAFRKYVVFTAGFLLSAAGAISEGFDYQNVLFGPPMTLMIAVKNVEPATGKVIIDGSDSRQPVTPFSFDWGDKTTDSGFFPRSHHYRDQSRSYQISVTAHYTNETTGQLSAPVRFGPARVTPQTLPADITVIIPAQAITLASRMPGYKIPAGLLPFNDDQFAAISRETVAYILSVGATMQKDFANDNFVQSGNKFKQVILREPSMKGMCSLWYTIPVAFVAGNGGFQITPEWSSFFHEMGHNITLNSPAAYCIGGKIDGPANAIFSETVAQIFQHAAAYEILNTPGQWGIDECLARELAQSALASMRIVRSAYDQYLAKGKPFNTWNDPLTGADETYYTFMTLAYRFFVHAETENLGYRTPVKRMMRLFQCFDNDLRMQYSQDQNTPEAARFRATFMIAGLSYAFSKDLRPELRALNFPVDDKIHERLIRRADAGRAR